MTPNKHFNTYKEGMDLEFLREYCMEHGELKRFVKGETLEEAGEPAQWIGFIVKGCFKYNVYNSVDNKEYITGFAFENEFVGDYPNCLSNRTSEVTIVATVPCVVYLITGDILNRLFKDSIGMKELKQVISDHLFYQVYSQYLDHYRKTSRERYKDLLLRCPEIVQKISLQDIASYLKVTPTTISTIRREITFGK